MGRAAAVNAWAHMGSHGAAGGTTCLVPSGVATSTPSTSTLVPVADSLLSVIPAASATSLVIMTWG